MLGSSAAALPLETSIQLPERTLPVQNRPKSLVPSGLQLLAEEGKHLFDQPLLNPVHVIAVVDLVAVRDSITFQRAMQLPHGGGDGKSSSPASMNRAR